MAKQQKKAQKNLVIEPPNEKIGEFHILGTSPYVQNAFSQKAKEQMKAVQEAGSTSRKNRKREAKNFQECYEASQHISTDGWHGMPCSGFRAALISACRLCGFAMTRAKLSLFVEADGFKPDGTGLVKIIKGNPRYVEHPVRLESGVCDIRARAMWDAGWEAKVRIRFDADQFTLEDVSNLLMRVGKQVGVGEGRPDSKKSCGMGWGEFELKSK